MVGSVDEDGEAVGMMPKEVDSGARDHVVFEVEDEGFLCGHMCAEVAALQLWEDGEFGC